MDRHVSHSRTTLALTALLALTAALQGCASLGNTEKGAAAGAAAGGVLGGIIGDQMGHTARGAIIGAAVGGTTGALIGRRMDQQAKSLEDELENATVERVGEGIFISFDSGLLFDFDSDLLRTEARANLTELAESLKEYDGTEVLIVGHTDSVGDASYNLRLSQRRAEAASRYLDQQGIDARRLRAEGRGEDEPVASNDTEAGRQQNRRVEVVIFAGDKLKERVGEDA